MNTPNSAYGPLLIAVMGTTASGKSEVAERIADETGFQLINADAFQVYRGMSIGTAKPSAASRYRLLDIREPNESFSVGEWVQMARAEIWTAYQANRGAIIVGGTGLYIRALFDGYANMSPAPSPELRDRLMEWLAKDGLPPLAEELKARAPSIAATTDLQNPVRVRRALERLDTPGRLEPVELPPIPRLKFVIQRDPLEIDESIRIRMHQMVQNGWLDEVANLRSLGIGPGDSGFRAIGYPEMWRHLSGEVELQVALESVALESRRYAKRQRTWLRSEKNLVTITGETAQDRIEAILAHLLDIVGGSLDG